MLSFQEGMFFSQGHIQGTAMENLSPPRRRADDLPLWTARPGTDDARQCPVRDVLDRLGDTWSVLVILILSDGPQRFNALKRAVGDISQRMLALTLRNLERDGLVSRTVLPANPPRVEYALTPLGRSLEAPIGALTEWATTRHATIREARQAFDAANGELTAG